MTTPTNQHASSTDALAIAKGLCPKEAPPEAIASIAMALRSAGDAGTVGERMETARAVYQAMPLWRELYDQ